MLSKLLVVALTGAISAQAAVTAASTAPVDPTKELCRRSAVAKANVDKTKKTLLKAPMSRKSANRVMSTWRAQVKKAATAEKSCEYATLVTKLKAKIEESGVANKAYDDLFARCSVSERADPLMVQCNEATDRSKRVNTTAIPPVDVAKALEVSEAAVKLRQEVKELEVRESALNLEINGTETTDTAAKPGLSNIRISDSVTGPARRKAIEYQVQSQMKLWKQVNERCDELGLSCAYGVGECIPAGRPSLTAASARSTHWWPVNLSWVAPARDTRDLQYTVLSYRNGELDYADKAVLPAVQSTTTTKTPVTFFRINAVPPVPAGGSATDVVEYMVVAEAPCQKKPKDVNGKVPHVFDRLSSTTDDQLDAAAFMKKYVANYHRVCPASATSWPESAPRVKLDHKDAAKLKVEFDQPTRADTGSDGKSVKQLVQTFALVGGAVAGEAAVVGVIQRKVETDSANTSSKAVQDLNLDDVNAELKKLVPEEGSLNIQDVVWMRTKSVNACGVAQSGWDWAQTKLFASKKCDPVGDAPPFLRWIEVPLSTAALALSTATLGAQTDLQVTGVDLGTLITQTQAGALC